MLWPKLINLLVYSFYLIVMSHTLSYHDIVALVYIMQLYHVAPDYITLSIFKLLDILVYCLVFFFIEILGNHRASRLGGKIALTMFSPIVFLCGGHKSGVHVRIVFNSICIVFGILISCKGNDFLIFWLNIFAYIFKHYLKI